MQGFFNHFQTLEKLLYYSKLGRGTWQGFTSIRLSLWRMNRYLESFMRPGELPRERKTRRWGREPSLNTSTCLIYGGLSGKVYHLQLP